MFKKLENLIVFLVAISAIAILVYQMNPRELTIHPSESVALTADDRDNGGSSIAVSESTNERFVYAYHIREGAANPYASLIIRPFDEEIIRPFDEEDLLEKENRVNEELLLDLCWMQNISITAHIEGRASDNFRLQLRNFEEEFYIPSDGVSRRYNEVCLKLTDQPTTTTISWDKFYVPGWWVERMSVPMENSTPVFDNIEWIELSTAGIPKTGKCKVIIDEIKFSGHWIPAGIFYQSILGMWLCFGSVVALSQIIGLRKMLSQSKTKQMSLQHQAAKLEELAILDPLTQLYNRRGMRTHATRAMQEQKQRGNNFSLIMFDIDNFKALNDDYGHCYGDGILKHVAAVVSARLSENEPLARWGGEEFLVICKGRQLDNATQLAQQLRKIIEEEVKVTCSFGVCEVGTGSEFSAALGLVDHCLYQAKDAGKNCVKSAYLDKCEEPELVGNSDTN